LNPEDRVRIHEEIFQLVYNGNGGFTHDEVYSMPIAIRHFNIRMLVLQRQREKEASEKQSDTNTITPKPVARPIIKKP
jgi:hypothetical protein